MSDQVETGKSRVEVAYMLLHDILLAENKMIQPGAYDEATKPSREDILDTFRQCLKATKGVDWR